MNKNNFFFIIIIIIFASCEKKKFCSKTEVNFNADSAFSYIEKQVSFGPRIPETPAHSACAMYLTKKMQSFGWSVKQQKAVVKRYDGKTLHIINIISSLDTSKKRRILLFAHWDTRFYADRESDSTKRLTGVPGANDGGSGVAILMEIARNLIKQKPKIGVDIIFFDAEDQGKPFYLGKTREKDWCLGAQYWSKNKNEKVNYISSINLDMVGAKGATFLQEDNSRFYHNFEVKRIWKLAKDLGYDSLFVNKFYPALLDDHVFVSEDAGIRSILITDTKSGKIPFFKYWHTLQDTPDKIDKQVLYKTGVVLMNYIYCLK